MAPSAMTCSSSPSRLVFPTTSKEAPQLDELLPTLLDCVLEELRQRAVPQPLLALLGMIYDQIRDQGARQSPRLLFRVLDHERIHGPQRAGHALRGRSTCSGPHRRLGG